MKISLNELKKYVDIKAPTDELVKLIGSRLVEIEETVNLSEKYKNIKIVKVAECEKIAGTHLSLCQIDAGEKNLIQVVCGAPNVRRGMLAVWLAPGAIVPSTFSKENFELGAKKLRGFDSNGMLAAADELDFWPDHEGILEIDPKDAKPGDNFAEKFDLNDIILDIENKSLTHRPDCFGLIGFAREVAGILGKKFINPEFLYKETVFPEGFLKIDEENNIESKNCSIKIKIQDAELCPRYSCAVLEVDQKISERSKYLQKSDIFLFKAGMRPISKIVDLTNILMLETGQPLHAFDYDKFVSVGGKEKPEISIRLARKGESLQLIDDKNVDLNENDILVTSNDVPVALAGAMGGKNTEIDSNTKKIILESATFSLYNLRKTQMSHGIFTEAITRFTKGQPASQTFNVLAEAVSRLDAEVVEVKDLSVVEKRANAIKIKISEINLLLGTNYDYETAFNALRNVGFIVEEHSGGLFEVFVPHWRTDIRIKEDIIEEVGRLLGYDSIPLSSPLRPFIGASIDEVFALKTRFRNILSDKLNANEILTYSFVSKNLLNKVHEDVENTYKIVNSISPELQCFRPSLVPSILDKIRENQKSGFSDFTLYELNQVSSKTFGFDLDGVPITLTHLGLTTFGDFYKIKALVSALMNELHVDFSISPIEAHSYFEPLHSAAISIEGIEIAVFGEIKSSVLKNFKLSDQISGLELDVEKILNITKTTISTPRLSKFPFVNRDLTVKVSTKTAYSEILDSIESILTTKDLVFKITPASIYQPKKSDETKNVSFHLSFSDPTKTLVADEISGIMEEITKKLSTTLGAEAV